MRLAWNWRQLLVVVFLVAACGGDDDGGGAADAGSEADAEPEAADAAPECVVATFVGPCVEEIDGDDDGFADSITINTYEDNLLATSDVDSNADGAFNYELRFTYDGEGRRTLIEYDNGADGSFEGTTTYMIGENGLASQADHTGFYADFRQRYTYDDQDRLLYFDSVEAGGDTVMSRTRHYYDDRGLLERTEYVTGEDGDVLAEATYVYDEHCRKLEVQGDVAADDTIDNVERFSYDLDNNLILVERDNENDGADDQSTHSSYACWD